MTTTVLIATQGNKEVLIETAGGKYILPPGRWSSFFIHDKQEIKVSEIGEFVDSGQGLRKQEE